MACGSDNDVPKFEVWRACSIKYCLTGDTMRHDSIFEYHLPAGSTSISYVLAILSPVAIKDNSWLSI